MPIANVTEVVLDLMTTHPGLRVTLTMGREALGVFMEVDRAGGKRFLSKTIPVHQLQAASFDVVAVELHEVARRLEA